MRFGFATIPAGPTSETVELVRFGEELGYDMAWIADQTFFKDVHVTLAACALATSRIGLGIGTTNPYTRHPVMTVRAAATLDELSGGRVTLSFGAGNRKELLYPLGYDGSKAAARCREAVAVAKDLLGGATVAFEGSTLVLRGVRLEFEPARRLPVFLAGRGPKILEAAGEIADGAIIGGLVSQTGLAYSLSMVRRGLSRAGRHAAEGFEVVSWVTCILADHPDETRENLRPLIAHLVGGAPPDVTDTLGFDAGSLARLKEDYAARGVKEAACHVTPDMIDAFTIVGSPETVGERLEGLSGLGVTQFVALLPVATPAGSHTVPGFDRRKNLERFAREVMWPMRESARGGA